MASPQTEDGFTQLANDIVEAMARLVLNSGESRCLWFIWRKTYGWHKRMDKLSLSQFTEATGMGPGHVCQSLSSLKVRNIILIEQAGHSKAYGFQKDYSLWDSKGKQGRRGDSNVSFLAKSQDSVITEDSVNSESIDYVNTESNPYVNTYTQKKEKDSSQKKKDPGRVAPTPNESKLKKSKAPPDPRTNVVMNRIQAECKQPIVHWAMHAAEAKKMLSAGYTEDQIFNCWKAMRDERKAWVRLSWVAEDIGDFVENGEKRPQKGNGSGRSDSSALGNSARSGGANSASNVTRTIPDSYAEERELERRQSRARA